MSKILTIRHLTGSLASKSQRVALQEGQTLRLGRAQENDIKFTDDGDDSVSSLHAELSLEGGRVFIEDKRSSNGTFVNGAPCPPFQKVAVPDGSRIRLAKQGPEMQLVIEPLPETAAAQPAATVGGGTVVPKESVGRGTLLREIDRARQEERDVLSGEIAKSRRNSGKWLGLGLSAVLLLAVVGIGGGMWWNHRKVQQEKNALEIQLKKQQESLENEKNLWANVEKKTSPAIVHIRCQWRVRIPRRSSVAISQGEVLFVGGVQGSGILIRPGLILTAKHVAEPWKLRFADWDKAVKLYDAKAEYDLLDVQFPGQQPLHASLVATAEQQDLALLQVQTTAAGPVPIVKSNADVRVTDRMAVLGYPADLGQKPVLMKNFSGFGAEWTQITQVTPTFVIGTVSQPMSSAPNFVFFDASVTHGNSGGAVINERGELIGVVSQKFQRQGVIELFGQQIPIQEPVEAGNMAVSPDDIQTFLRNRGLG